MHITTETAERLPSIKTTKLVRYFRITRIVLHTFVGLFIAALVLPFVGAAIRLKLIHWWCSRLLGAFNIQVITRGFVPDTSHEIRGNIFVANHISWADIHALNSVLPLRFIAKSEIRSWPVFGYLAHKAHVLFIDRSKRQDAARIVNTAAQALSNGDNLCLFPEGTTTDGTEMKPFKSSLIQAAIQAHATIHPVAIRYQRADGSTNTEMAYAGDTTLQESMLNVLSQRNPTVELCFLAPIDTSKLAENDRRSLTKSIEKSIRTELKL